MMNKIVFALSLLVTLGLTYVLNRPLSMGSTSVPPMGKMLNPFTGFWQNADRIDSRMPQEINMTGLQSPVKVVYDERLVPHIFGDNLKDVIKVQGYVTAQHRLWQMDISTRATSGRLAEIMGEGLVDRDKTQRRMGLGYAAENAVAEWEKDNENFGLVEAYRDGVNAYISQLEPADYPVEFKLLNYKPEPWTTLKSAIFVKSMAQTLCFREDDLESSNALEHFGREIFDFLYPEHNPKQSPIIPVDTEWDFETTLNHSDATPSPLGAFGHRPYEKPDPYIGSNNWAVHGSRTASGNPILCSDPHLNLTLPSIWFEVQLNTPDINTYGVSLPGLPGVIIGFNEDVAWGQTNVGQDVTDWYKIDWADEDKMTYMLDGQRNEVELRLEEIKVKGGKTVVDTVRYTTWGPVVHLKDDSHQDLALRWLAHDQHAPDELAAFIGLNKAKNYDDYSEALEKYISPAQNYVFASREGDIAIKANGRFPIKSKEQGRFVQDGSKSTAAWNGYIPMDQVPQIKNPERGWVSSANQRSAAPDYPYYFNGGFDDYRGRILNRKLAELDNVTVEDMMALQNNNESIKAEEALSLFLALIKDETLAEKEASAFQMLNDWDFNYEKDLAAPVLFEIWYREYYRALWDEIYDIDEQKPFLYPEHWRTLELIEQDPDHIFFDHQETNELENAKDIAIRSFKSMLEKVEEMEGEMEGLKWEDYKGTRINHLGRIPAFTSDVVSVGGVGDALNATRRGGGPSWRMIVELGQEVKAYGIYPGGQSGNPGSPFYSDMIQDWADGKYYELKFVQSPEELTEISIGTTTFQ